MLILCVTMGNGLKDARNFMGVSGQVIQLALSIFQALVEFSGKTSVILHRSCNEDCPCYEKKNATSYVCMVVYGTSQMQ